MFCKLLILKDKLRVALEWIHSRHARAAKASRLGRYNARPTRKGCTRMQSRLTRQGKAATLRSIDTQKARHSTNPAQAAQDARESARHSEDASEKKQTSASRTAQREKKQMQHASAQTAQSTAQATRHSASRTDCTGRTGCEGSEPHQPHQHERPPAAALRCHGGSGQRVRSEGVSHERTKFRCT